MVSIPFVYLLDDFSWLSIGERSRCIAKLNQNNPVCCCYRHLWQFIHVRLLAVVLFIFLHLHTYTCTYVTTAPLHLYTVNYIFYSIHTRADASVLCHIPTAVVALDNSSTYYLLCWYISYVLEIHRSNTRS